MKSMRLLLASALLLAASALTASGDPVTYKIDPGHSQVGFSIRHFFSRVSGRFNQFAGTLVYDDKNVANSSAEVTIQTASIFTNNERRDNDLRGANFFLADSFPTITFKSTQVVAGEGNHFKIEGVLTMHGVSRPVTLDASLLGVGAIGMNGRAMGTRAGFEATAMVDRKDFGVVWNRTLDQGGTMLGDEVQIAIGLEAVKVDDESASIPDRK